MKFAVVVSKYNPEVTRGLLKGALNAFKSRGVQGSDLQVFWVPGAFEIPLTALKLAQSKKFSAVVCLGCVLKGETPHNDYISRSVSEGIQRASLRTGVPLSFGVLTPNNGKQARARSGNNRSNKGSEAALAAFEMAAVLKKIGKG